MNACKQQGMSSIGLLFVLGLASFFLLCGFKLVPLYLDSFFVQGSLNKLRNEDLVKMSNGQIRGKIDRHFSVDGIRDLSVRDVKIEREKERVILTLDYEKRIDFLGNVDVVLDFAHRLDTAEE